MEARHLQSFSAPRGWGFVCFLRSQSLLSVQLRGEAGEVNVSDVGDDIAKRKFDLREYVVENMYNADETGLFFKLLPNRTYVRIEEDKKSLWSVKGMK